MLLNLEVRSLWSVWEYMNPESLGDDSTDWVCIPFPVVSIQRMHAEWHSTVKPIVCSQHESIISESWAQRIWGIYGKFKSQVFFPLTSTSLRGLPFTGTSQTIQAFTGLGPISQGQPRHFPKFIATHSYRKGVVCQIAMLRIFIHIISFALHKNSLRWIPLMDAFYR